MATYLLEGALGLQKGDDDKEWDTGHGRQSQEPANGISPRRVHVDIVVFERCVLAQGEEEGGLKGRRGRVRQEPLRPCAGYTASQGQRSTQPH